MNPDEREEPSLPRLSLSMYWQQKEKFLMYEDTYPHWTIFAVEDGSFYFEIADSKGTAAFGDLVVCPPGVPFRRVVVTPVTFYFLQAQHEPGAACEPAPFPAGKIAVVRHTARLASDYAILRSVETYKEPLRKRLLEHCLRDFELMLRLESEPETLSLRQSGPPTVDPLMEEAAAFIRQHALQPLQLKSLAAALGLSPVQLTKRFKTSFGTTPIDFLTELRLDKAKTLLLETKLTIEQIAECCGYQTGFYLHRLFTKRLNISPSQFRKAYLV